MRFLSLTLALCAFVTPHMALAQEKEETAQGAKPAYTLTDTTYQNDHGKIVYPVFFGSADPQTDMAVNIAIYSEGKIDQRITTLNSLQAGGWGLDVSYKAYLKEDILSITLSALGDMGKGWSGQEYGVITFDLLAGKVVAPEELFLDVEKAFTFMETTIDESLYPTLSGYMTNDAMTPLPRTYFALDDLGITFYYSPEAFSFLSGYSGSTHFLYAELEEFLNLKTNSSLARLGVKESLTLTDDSLPLIEQAIKEGTLPQVPVAIGDKLPHVIEEHRLLSDPDNFPGGRFIHIEDPLFRQVWLITDNLHSGYDQSIVQGIRTTRGNLYGLITGKTTQKQWRQVLGEPASTFEVDEQTAYEYWLEPGVSDYYRFGDYQLRLHGDEQGVLSCIMVVQ